MSIEVSHLNLIKDEVALASDDCLFECLREKTIKNPSAFLFEAFKEGLGFIFPTEDTVYLIPYPKYHSDGERFHNERGAALEWASGEKKYFWQGVEVPQKVILWPEKIRLKEILKEPNVARRWAMISRMPRERFFHLLKHHKIIDKSIWGILYEGGFDRQRIALLEVECPSTKHRHFLFVPPEMETALRAIAWTYELSPEEYLNLILRT